MNHIDRRVVALLMALILVFTACGASMSALAEVLKLPAAMKWIGERAFYGNKSLDEVVIPEGAEYIGPEAFGNSSVSVVTIPETVVEIADDAFVGVVGAQIKAPVGSPAWSFAVENDMLFEEATPASAFTYRVLGDQVSCAITGLTEGQTELKIPSVIDGYKVTMLDDYALSACIDLVRVVVPDSVTYIGKNVFRGCTSLTEITLPFVGASREANGTKDAVLGYLFGEENRYDTANISQNYANGSTQRYCIPASLSSITLTDAVQVPYGAFSNCRMIEHISILCDIETIGDYAFRNCSALTAFPANKGIQKIGMFAFADCRSMAGPIELPEGLTTLGNQAFYRCEGITSLTAPSTLADIGNSVFSSCTGLVNVDLAEGITAIGNSMFSGCSHLMLVNIPDSVTTIGTSAFNNCAAMTSVTIPDSVVTIETAFYGCNAIESMTLPFVGRSRTPASAAEGKLRWIFYGRSDTEGGYQVPEGLKQVVLTDTTSIGEWAFASCSSLENVCIRCDVTDIGRYAFYGCTLLKNVDLPDSVQTIGKSAFTSCSSLERIVIPPQVTTIEDETFSFCSGLTQVVFNDAVTAIGNQAFFRCSSLTAIRLPDSVEQIGSMAFQWCTGLVNVRFPDSLTMIGEDAFARCQSLANVVLPGSITSIASGTFSYCDQLKTVVIPYGVTGIGSSAFSGCSSLQNIMLPASITEIGAQAFYWCEQLQTIVIPEGVQEIKRSTFTRCSGMTAIYIPASVTSVFYDAFDYCTSLTDVYYGGDDAAWEAIGTVDGLKNVQIHYDSMVPGEILPVVYGGTFAVDHYEMKCGENLKLTGKVVTVNTTLKGIAIRLDDERDVYAMVNLSVQGLSETNLQDHEELALDGTREPMNHPGIHTIKLYVMTDDGQNIWKLVDSAVVRVDLDLTGEFAASDHTVMSGTQLPVKASVRVVGDTLSSVSIRLYDDQDADLLSGYNYADIDLSDRLLNEYTLDEHVFVFDADRIPLRMPGIYKAVLFAETVGQKEAVKLDETILTVLPGDDQPELSDEIQVMTNGKSALTNGVDYHGYAVFMVPSDGENRMVISRDGLMAQDLQIVEYAFCGEDDSDYIALDEHLGVPEIIQDEQDDQCVVTFPTSQYGEGTLFVTVRQNSSQREWTLALISYTASATRLYLPNVLAETLNAHIVYDTCLTRSTGDTEQNHLSVIEWPCRVEVLGVLNDPLYWVVQIRDQNGRKIPGFIPQTNNEKQGIPVLTDFNLSGSMRVYWLQGENDKAFMLRDSAHRGMLCVYDGSNGGDVYVKIMDADETNAFLSGENVKQMFRSDANRTLVDYENGLTKGFCGIANDTGSIVDVSQKCIDALMNPSDFSPAAMLAWFCGCMGRSTGAESFGDLETRQAAWNLQPVYINKGLDQVLSDVGNGSTITIGPAGHAIAYAQDNSWFVNAASAGLVETGTLKSNGMSYRKYSIPYSSLMNDKNLRYFICAGYGDRTEQVWLLSAKVGNVVLDGNGDEIYRLCQYTNGQFDCKENTLPSIASIATGSGAGNCSGKYTANPNNFLYWDASTRQYVGSAEWRDRIHFTERFNLNDDASLPQNVVQAIRQGFHLLPKQDSQYHQFDPKLPEYEYHSCLKYIHNDGRQAIYLILVTGCDYEHIIARDERATMLLPLSVYPKVGPTFNYSPNDYGENLQALLAKGTPKSVAHFYFDMLPYYWWGNGAGKQIADNGTYTLYYSMHTDNDMQTLLARIQSIDDSVADYVEHVQSALDSFMDMAERLVNQLPSAVDRQKFWRDFTTHRNQITHDNRKILPTSLWQVLANSADETVNWLATDVGQAWVELIDMKGRTCYVADNSEQIVFDTATTDWIQLETCRSDNFILFGYGVGDPDVEINGEDEALSYDRSTHRLLPGTQAGTATVTIRVGHRIINRLSVKVINTEWTAMAQDTSTSLTKMIGANYADRLAGKILLADVMESFSYAMFNADEAARETMGFHMIDGIAHSTLNCWQKECGYSELYDVVFDVATNMKRLRLPFSYNGKDYILWAWKGDYLNLGAGAELGFYVRNNKTSWYWDIDTSLSMTMTLNLSYQGKTIIDWRPTQKQWWVTAFVPRVNNPDTSKLTAVYTVRFDDVRMFRAFMNQHANDPRIDVNEQTSSYAVIAIAF